MLCRRHALLLLLSVAAATLPPAATPPFDAPRRFRRLQCRYARHVTMLLP